MIFKHLPSVIPKLFPIAKRYLLFLTFLRLIVGQIALRSAFVSFTDSPFSPLILRKPPAVYTIPCGRNNAFSARLPALLKTPLRFRRLLLLKPLCKRATHLFSVEPRIRPPFFPYGLSGVCRPTSARFIRRRFPLCCLPSSPRSTNAAAFARSDPANCGPPAGLRSCKLRFACFALRFGQTAWL